MPDYFEENLRVVSVTAMQDEDRLEYLLSQVPGLTNQEREELICAGYDPDTGRDLD